MSPSEDSYNSFVSGIVTRGGNCLRRRYGEISPRFYKLLMATCGLVCWIELQSPGMSVLTCQLLPTGAHPSGQGECAGGRGRAGGSGGNPSEAAWASTQRAL